jgi:hypothetical protein
MITLPGVGPVQPVVLLIALVAGFVIFLLFRGILRAFHFILQLGCLAIVVVGVIFILRNVIK